MACSGCMTKMNKTELLIEIGHLATNEQLDEYLETLRKQNCLKSGPSNNWTLEDQLKHSHEQGELLFKEQGVHWDQRSESSGYRSSLEERMEQTLQRCSLGKKGSN